MLGALRLLGACFPGKNAGELSMYQHQMAESLIRARGVMCLDLAHFFLKALYLLQ